MQKQTEKTSRGQGTTSIKYFPFHKAVINFWLIPLSMATVNLTALNIVGFGYLLIIADVIGRLIVLSIVAYLIHHFIEILKDYA